MSKNLKFRAYDESTGIMYGNVGLRDGLVFSDYSYDDYGNIVIDSSYILDEPVVMSYLSDFSGKCEGDIIKGKFSSETETESFGIIRDLDSLTSVNGNVFYGFVIEWVLNNPKGEEKYSLINKAIKNFEVVGNIWEDNAYLIHLMSN